MAGDVNFMNLLATAERCRQYTAPGYVELSPYVMGLARVFDKYRYSNRRRLKREIIKFTAQFLRSA
jgi:hypothetical protein